MHQIRRIIELHQQGRSIRETERLTGLSRNTIREYLRRIAVNGLTCSEILSLEDESLIPIVHVEAIEKSRSGRTTDKRYGSFESRLEYYCSELRRRGVTRYLLWKEYRTDHTQGYSYSQFCEHLGRYLKRDQAVMHFTHQAGEQL